MFMPEGGGTGLAGDTASILPRQPRWRAEARTARRDLHAGGLTVRRGYVVESGRCAFLLPQQSVSDCFDRRVRFIKNAWICSPCHHRPGIAKRVRVLHDIETSTRKLASYSREFLGATGLYTLGADSNTGLARDYEAETSSGRVKIASRVSAIRPVGSAAERHAPFERRRVLWKVDLGPSS